VACGAIQLAVSHFEKVVVISWVFIEHEHARSDLLGVRVSIGGLYGQRPNHHQKKKQLWYSHDYS